MNKMNGQSAVKQQYAAVNNLYTGIAMSFSCIQPGIRKPTGVFAFRA